MFVPGLKEVVQAAYSNNKFLTNGKKLPEIDFEQPLSFEVTALDSLSLVSIIKIKDDTILDYGREFSRTLYLQMIAGCSYEDTIIGMLKGVPDTRRCLTDVRKIRISITGFTAVGRTPFIRRDEEQTEHPRGAGYRKLVIEKANFMTELA